MIQQVLFIVIVAVGGFCAGQNYEAKQDRQLIDHALYECSKQNKVQVALKEMEDGDCQFVALGVE